MKTVLNALEFYSRLFLKKRKETSQPYVSAEMLFFSFVRPTQRELKIQNSHNENETQSIYFNCKQNKSNELQKKLDKKTCFVVPGY